MGDQEKTEGSIEIDPFIHSNNNIIKYMNCKYVLSIGNNKIGKNHTGPVFINFQSRGKNTVSEANLV